MMMIIILITISIRTSVLNLFLRAWYPHVTGLNLRNDCLVKVLQLQSKYLSEDPKVNTQLELKLKTRMVYINTKIVYKEKRLIFSTHPNSY